MYLRRRNIDKRDQEKPRVWRAAIYLSESDPKATGAGSEPSIARQRRRCHSTATALGAEVLGEFVDTRLYVSLWPELHQALELAQEQRLDYLIVSSLDRLPKNRDDVFEVAWRLGHAGTVPTPASEDD